MGIPKVNWRYYASCPQFVIYYNETFPSHKRSLLYVYFFFFPVEQIPHLLNRVYIYSTMHACLNTEAQKRSIKIEYQSIKWKEYEETHNKITIYARSNRVDEELPSRAHKGCSFHFLPYTSQKDPPPYKKQLCNFVQRRSLISILILQIFLSNC